MAVFIQTVMCTKIENLRHLGETKLKTLVNQPKNRYVYHI